jgi:hypothetical protein
LPLYQAEGEAVTITNEITVVVLVELPTMVVVPAPVVIGMGELWRGVGTTAGLVGDGIELLVATAAVVEGRADEPTAELLGGAMA